MIITNTTSIKTVKTTLNKLLMIRVLSLKENHSCFNSFDRGSISNYMNELYWLYNIQYRPPSVSYVPKWKRMTW